MTTALEFDITQAWQLAKNIIISILTGIMCHILLWVCHKPVILLWCNAMDDS